MIYIYIYIYIYKYIRKDNKDNNDFCCWYQNMASKENLRNILVRLGVRLRVKEVVNKISDNYTMSETKVFMWKDR